MLTWFHFSDLHMPKNDLFEHKKVIGALWEDIKHHINLGFIPDFVAFSGDVAQCADTDEYNNAIELFFEPLIKHTQINIENLIIVPGNHDINREMTESLQNPLPKLTCKEELRKLQEETLLQIYSTRFDNYLWFHNQLLCQQDIDPLFNLYRIIDIGKTKIAICGLNSAWLSGFNKDKEDNTDDDGYLAIGEVLVKTLLENVKEASLRIAVCHHPLEMLLSIDKAGVEKTIRNSFDFLLNGHLHDTNILQLGDLYGDINIIKAGSIGGCSKTSNSYNIVQINLNTGRGKVILRKYNEKRDEWQKDTESTGDKRDGSVDLEVSKITRSLRKEKNKEKYPDIDDIEKMLETNPLVFFDKFKISFHENIKNAMMKFKLTEKQIIDLIKSEFRAHLNYFRFDIQDYPMPVKSNYIIYLTKIGTSLEFLNMISCTHDKTILTSWDNILSYYRRVTRMGYRKNPKELLNKHSMINRVTVMHEEIRELIKKHFFEYIKSTSNKDAEQINLYLNKSKQADKEALDCQEMLNNGDIYADDALKLITPALEHSLQFIHKIIISFPPI